MGFSISFSVFTTFPGGWSYNGARLCVRMGSGCRAVKWRQPGLSPQQWSTSIGFKCPKGLPQEADGGLGLCKHKPHAWLKQQEAGREVLFVRA